MSAKTLTYTQWTEKHSTKLKGLSKKDISIRYDQYLAATTGSRRGKAIKERAVYTARKNPGRNDMIVVNVPRLSKCSQMYLRALIDPFTPFGELPCIPDAICIPSYKFGTRVRGNFVIGTGGVGWVVAAPFLPTIDSFQALSTTSAYVLNVYNRTAAGVVGSINDSAFSNATAPNLQYRLVGCGLRAWFQGSEFNRGGLVVLHRQPQNTDILAGTNENDFLRYRTTIQAPAVRKSESVCYRPDDPAQFAYNPYVIAPGGDPRYSLLIYVTGATLGQTWGYELFNYYEMIGDRQQPTQSHSDSSGMGAVMSSLPVVNSTQPPAAQLKEAHAKSLTALEYASSGLVAVAKSALNQALPVVAGAIGEFFAGPPGGLAAGAATRLLTSQSASPTVSDID